MKSPAPRWRGTLCSPGQHSGLKAGSRFQRHMSVLEEERCDEEATGQGVVGAVKHRLRPCRNLQGQEVDNLLVLLVAAIRLLLRSDPVDRELHARVPGDHRADVTIGVRTGGAVISTNHQAVHPPLSINLREGAHVCRGSSRNAHILPFVSEQSYYKIPSRLQKVNQCYTIHI